LAVSLTATRAERFLRQTAAAVGFDGRQAFVVQHDRNIQLRLECRDLGHGCRCGRTPIARQGQREPYDDKAGAQL
jgi:hypothetical protein